MCTMPAGHCLSFVLDVRHYSCAGSGEAAGVSGHAKPKSGAIQKGKTLTNHTSAVVLLEVMCTVVVPWSCSQTPITHPAIKVSFPDFNHISCN